MKDLPVTEADPSEVQRQIEDILDSPEYDYSDPWYAPITDWIREQIDSVLEWLGRRIQSFFDLFSGVGPGGVGGSGTFWRIVGYVIIAAAVLFIARLIWRVVQDRLPKPVSYDREPMVAIDKWRRPKELLADAERFEQEGLWDEALRARYRYVIAELVERRLIDNPPGRTTGEYMIEVGRWLPASSEGFSTITATFEGVWYGEDAADRAAVDALRATGDHVLSSAKSRARSDTDGFGDVAEELVG